MQTGQVPVWVPISVGLLGMLGVILGQVINSWRESQRWKRELAREDVRWEREQVRYREQHSHDDRQKTRELQLQCYSEFVTVMAKIEANILVATHIPDGSEDEFERLLRKHDDLVNEASQLTAKIELVGTKDVADSATHFKETGEMGMLRMRGKERDENGLIEATNVIDSIFKPYNRSQENFVKAARVAFLSSEK